MAWRYTTAAQSVVWRRLPSGQEESRLAVDHVPAPGDTPIEPAHTAVLTASKGAIAADGVDATVITATWADPNTPAPASLTLVVGGLPQTVSLAGGAGSLPPLTATSPCEIAVAVQGAGAWHEDNPVRCAPLTITAE